MNRLSIAKLIAGLHESDCPFAQWDEGVCNCAQKRKEIVDKLATLLVKNRL